MKSTWLLIPALWSLTAVAGPGKKMIEGGLGEGELPALAEILEARGWTMTQDRSSSYTPGDIYSQEHQSVVMFGKECFEGSTRQGSYPSVEVVKALSAGGKVPLGVARFEAKGIQYKRLTFAEPYVEERSRMSLLQPSDQCVEDILINWPNLDDLFVLQSLLFAEVKEQVCVELSGAARVGGIGGEVSAKQDCTQASEGHVVVAYKTMLIADVLRNSDAEGGGAGSGTTRMILDDGGARTASSFDKRSHVVHFDTEIPGAIVRSDASLACHPTPCSKALSTGRHFIVIERERYEAFRQKIEVPKDKRIRATLQPKFGWLQVETGGKDLEYTVNGRDAGRVDGQPQEVWPGRYTVRLNDDCFLKDGQEDQVRKGETTVVRINPVARTTTVDLVATDGAGNDLDAEVLIDGQSLRARTPITFPTSVCTGEIVVKYRGRTARGRPDLKVDGTTYLEAVFGRGGKAVIRLAEEQRFRQGAQEVERLIAQGQLVAATTKAKELTQRYADRADPWGVLGDAHRASQDWSAAWRAYREFLARRGKPSTIRHVMAEVESHLIHLIIDLRPGPDVPPLNRESIEVRVVGPTGVDPVGDGVYGDGHRDLVLEGDAPEVEYVTRGDGVGVLVAGVAPGDQRLHILPGPRLQPLFVPMSYPGGTTQKMSLVARPVQYGPVQVDPIDRRLSLHLVDAILDTWDMEHMDSQAVRGSATMVAMYGESTLRLDLEVGDGQTIALPWAYQVRVGARVLDEGLVEPAQETVRTQVKLPMGYGTVPVEGVIRGAPGRFVDYELDPSLHPAHSHSRVLARLARAGNTNRALDWGFSGAGAVATMYGGIQLISARTAKVRAAQIIDPAQVDTVRTLNENATARTTRGAVGLISGGLFASTALVHYFLFTKTHRKRVEQRRQAHESAMRESVDLEQLRR